jgi:hypothetical protein
MGLPEKILPIAWRAAVLLLALGAAACSSVSNFISTDNADKASAAANVAATGNAEIPPDDVPCPDVSVRVGASTLAISDKGKPAEPGEVSGLDLRYQASIVRTARECRVASGVMTIKVGIEGRIVLGPAGGPGQLDVPIRLAVVREGPEPRTVTSKLDRVPVAIGEGVDHVNFTHVDQDVAFPLPRALGEMDSYVVYVGYDPQALAPEKPRSKPRRKR